ncbi:MAG: hypothetical protein IV100_31185, partial [Myxococcales bacterium]|nr:hypothetical protein [Myxococcales bacterium]
MILLLLLHVALVSGDVLFDLASAELTDRVVVRMPQKDEVFVTNVSNTFFEAELSSFGVNGNGTI